MPRTATPFGRIGASIAVKGNAAYADDARELERLGYSTLWISGGQLDTLDPIEAVLGATHSVTVATSVIPTGIYPAAAVTAVYDELEAAHPARFVVGLGAEQTSKQLGKLGRYLDDLDAAEPAVPIERRLLAAIGPRKLALARDRFAGALPLLVTTEYTTEARAVLGADSTLVIHQFVVPETDPDRARAAARGRVGFLTRVGGYVRSLRRMGFTEDEIAEPGERLIDAVVSWGDTGSIAAGVEAHLDAGAGQVAINLALPNGNDARSAWRDLAEVLIA